MTLRNTLLLLLGLALNGTALHSLIFWKPLFGLDMPETVPLLLLLAGGGFATGALLRRSNGPAGVLLQAAAVPVLLWFGVLFVLFVVFGASR